MRRALLGRALRATGLLRPEVVIFDVTHRCTSRCVGCAFREPEPGELPVQRWVSLAQEARELGFREIVLTGGEPLAHPEIDALLQRLSRELPVSLLTNGLALRRHAEIVKLHATRVYVSWDAADDETYLRIRGVRGHAALRGGVQALGGHPTHARVTVWAENAEHLRRILDDAADAGCDEASLLAPDVTSGAFGDRGEARGTPPDPDQVASIHALLDAGHRILVMSEFARRRVLSLLRGVHEAPPCLAPWTSGVVDPTGGWRHCFFLSTGVETGRGLADAIRASRSERRDLDLARNPTCARCVCWRG